MIRRARARLARWRLAPDGLPRPDAPFGRGPLAARVLAVVISVAVGIGARTPAALAHVLAVVGGHAEWALRPGKRRRLAANVAHAVGSSPGDRRVRRLVRRAVVNEAHRSADLLWALGRPRDFLDSTELVGFEGTRPLVAAGEGMIFMGIHLGGWELATAVPRSVLGVTATALVADDWLAWAIGHMRTRVGLQVAYRTAPVSRLGARLEAGEALVVLGDDATGPRPRVYKVRFCDTFAELPAGGVTVARLYQVPVVGFSVVRLGRRRWRVTLDPPLAPPPRHAGVAGDQETLQRLADRWSDLVGRHPDQWSASYRIAWLD